MRVGGQNFSLRVPVCGHSSRRRNRGGPGRTFMCSSPALRMRASAAERAARICVPSSGLTPCYRASSRSRALGSASATSSIFNRLRAPATSVTESRPTPNAAATAASAAVVALPSTARSLTRTTRAPSCCPPSRDGQTRAGPGQRYAPGQFAPRKTCNPPTAVSRRPLHRPRCLAGQWNSAISSIVPTILAFRWGWPGSRGCYAGVSVRSASGTVCCMAPWPLFAGITDGSGLRT
jgi:hypothetical protein